MKKRIIAVSFILFSFLTSAEEKKRKLPHNSPQFSATESVDQIQKWYQSETTKILNSNLTQKEKQNRISRLTKQLQEKVNKTTRKIQESIDSYARLNGENLTSENCKRFDLPEKLIINQKFLIQKSLQCNKTQVLAYYLPDNDDFHNFKFMFGISAHKTGFAQQESLLWLKKIRKRLPQDPLANATLFPAKGSNYDLDIFVAEPKFLEHNYWSFTQKGEGYIQYQYIRRLYPQQRTAGIDFEAPQNEEESHFIKGIPQFRKEAEQYLQSDSVPSPKPF